MKSGIHIGLFGGTFDPPHHGHIIVAEHAMKSLGLSEIRFIPAARPPHKEGETEASPKDRLAMISLAIANRPGLTVSDIEFRRDALSYTAETVLEFKRREPLHAFWLLIGMDNAVEFHLWRDPEMILSQVTVVALTRPGFKRSVVADSFRNRFVYCEVPPVPVSSTEIRSRVARGESIHDDVPAPVESYIIERGLYRTL